MNPRSVEIKRTAKPKPKKSKPRAEANRLQKKADAMIQEINRRTYEYCDECGGPNDVGHHFIRKSACADLRYDLLNIIPLCTNCHTKHHKDNPSLGVPITRRRGYPWHDRLKRIQLEASERLNANIRTARNAPYYRKVIKELESRLEMAAF